MTDGKTDRNGGIVRCLLFDSLEGDAKTLSKSPHKRINRRCTAHATLSRGSPTVYSFRLYYKVACLTVTWLRFSCFAMIRVKAPISASSRWRRCYAPPKRAVCGGHKTNDSIFLTIKKNELMLITNY